MEKVSDIAPFGVRMPSEIKTWVKENAKKNRRTMNAEIVLILENEKARSALTPQALIDANPNT